jgi:hypothetical protein
MKGVDSEKKVWEDAFRQFDIQANVGDRSRASLELARRVLSAYQKFLPLHIASLLEASAKEGESLPEMAGPGTAVAARGTRWMAVLSAPARTDDFLVALGVEQYIGAVFGELEYMRFAVEKTGDSSRPLLQARPVGNLQRLQEGDVIHCLALDELVHPAAHCTALLLGLFSLGSTETRAFRPNDGIYLFSSMDPAATQMTALIEALRALDAVEAIPILSDFAANADSPGVRWKAIQAVAGLDAEAALPLLRRATADPSDVIRVAATRALLRLERQ